MEIEGESYNGLRVRAVHDLSLALVDAPTKLKPGVPNELQWRIGNDGNGPAMAVMQPVDVNEAWDWWLERDGVNITGAIRLDGTPDDPNEQNISMWVMIPLNSPAGGLNALKVELSHQKGEADLTLENNAVEVFMSTEAVRIPSLQLIDQSPAAMAGTTVFAQAIIQNDGNAPESRLTSVGRVSSTPPVPGLVVFYSVEGADLPVDAPSPLLIGAGGSQVLQLEVLIPEDASLNTRFVLEFEILGVVDDEGLPVQMKTQALIMLNQQRSLASEAGLMLEGAVPHGTAAPVQVNATSTSTMNEQILVNMLGEAGWQVTCNKILVNESGVEVTLSPGHITPQTTNQRCEILRLDGPQQGELIVTVSTVDGSTLNTHSLALAFEPAPEADTMSGAVVAAGGGGLLIVLALTVLFMRRQRDGLMVDEEDLQEIAQPAGPPVSTATTAKEVPRIEEGLNHAEALSTEHGAVAGPPIPEGGIPAGWTEEQWQYYGQQYLDGTL